MSPVTDSGKHVAALREHLEAAQHQIGRVAHHLHNASSEAAVVGGCEPWAAILTEAHDLTRRAFELVQPLSVDDVLGAA